MGGFGRDSRAMRRIEPEPGGEGVFGGARQKKKSSTAVVAGTKELGGVGRRSGACVDSTVMQSETSVQAQVQFKVR